MHLIFMTLLDVRLNVVFGFRLAVRFQKRERADKAREESDKKKANYSQGKMFGVSKCIMGS